jgi:hypothetical protein
VVGRNIVRKAMVMMGAAVVALVGAAPAASAGVPDRVAAAKTVSVEKYAKSLCTTYTAWQDAVTGEQIPTANITDATAGKQALSDYLTSVGTATKAAIAKLKKAGIPDVDNGKKVAKSFRTFLSGASSEISGALSEVDAADPTSPDFVATITRVTTELTTLDSRLGDPFSKVGSQDLLGAFKDEKSCKGVVTIIGG